MLSFVLTPILGPGALVQTISVAMLINNLTKINVFRKGIDWAQCLFVVACAAPGCVIGSFVYSSLSERAITIVLGVFLIGIVIFKWVAARRYRPLATGHRGGVVVRLRRADGNHDRRRHTSAADA